MFLARVYVTLKPAVQRPAGVDRHGRITQPRL